ncbi:nitroreductase family protein [Levilactobacillus angrenensis]|uniref:Nitroreductase family protein n=1 Tax=Levilactobacillus angrenensis TaxID=2486020 RepID=A0ABW1U8M5_9LACO|nr:nitroreductase family protein [Levilactobacillus angrenensis]
MDFTEVVNQRHSTRDFTDQVIDAEVLRKLVQQAQQAASWANAQPWQVVIATGETLQQIRQQHRQLTQQGILGNADLTVAHRTEWSASARQNIATWNTEFSQHLRQTGNEIDFQSGLFNAPAIAYLVVQAPVNEWEIFDLGAFAQLLELSATNQGIQSIPAYELIKYPDMLRQTLGLEADHRLIMGIALGYESQQPVNQFRSSRVKQTNMLTIKD